VQEETRNRLALASLIVGLSCLLCILVPACGVVTALAGIILGILGIRSERRILAIIGIVASTVGLVGSVAHMAFTAQMIMNGEHPLIRPPGSEPPPQHAPLDSDAG